MRTATEVAVLIELGVLSGSGLAVAPADEPIQQALAAAEADARTRYPVGAMGAIPAIKAVRQIFSALGIDPTRTRPSSEALLRRAVQGKGLPLVNNVVDVVNLCSLRALLPVGLYDRQAIRGEIRLELGGPGAAYQGLGKDEVGLKGRLALHDDAGPFGAPTSDSFRTRVHAGTTEILCVIFAPRLPAGSNPALAAALGEIRDMLIKFCAVSADCLQTSLPV